MEFFSNKSYFILNFCQNISEEALLAASKTQTKIPSEDCIQGGGQLFTTPLRRNG